MYTKTRQTAPEAAYTNGIPNTPIRFIVHTSKPHVTYAVTALIAMVLAQVFASLSPYVLKQIVDGFTVLTESGSQLTVLAKWGSLYVAFLAVSFLFWRLSGFIGMEWLTRMNKTAYEELFVYITHHSNEYFSNRFAGALSNKISNASDGSHRLVERSLWGWIPEFMALAVGVFLFASVDTYIAIGFLSVVVAMATVNLILVRRRRPHVVAFAAASSVLRGEGVDLLTNIAASRQYSRRAYEMDRIESSTSYRRVKDLIQWRLSEWSVVLNNVVSVLLVGSILYYSYTLFQAGSISTGDIILIIAVLGRLVHVINFLGNMMNGFMRLYGEIEEGLGTVLLSHDVTDANTAKTFVPNGGAITWSNVHFEYSGSPVFKGFNLAIKPGQRIGLVGTSGAGKTTFVSLLLRQHDINGGSIEIDGQNIAAVTQDSLRENISIVPQEPMLFHRTIKENIIYGKLDATDEEIVAVAKKAQAHDFISALPEGYDTMVGERGVKLSGGQKQRVAIARAMLKNAPILVLDEATSALDSESEVAIQQALHVLMEGKTVVAIAHRLSTLREMDRIIVMDRGQIVEDGTHATLSKGKGVYARLWDHQAGGFLQED